MAIERGAKVEAHTASGDWVPLRAASGVEDGQDFQIVWVCDEDAWRRALAGEEPDAIPWPADELKERRGGNNG